VSGRISARVMKASAAPATATHTKPSLVHEVSRTPGRSLDDSKRAFMEPRLGHDFGKLRIHAEERAAESTQPAAPLLRSGLMLARETDDEKPPPPGTFFVPIHTAQAEREREVEAVESGGKPYVLYQTEVRYGSKSSSWLAKNPGNLDYTEHTKEWGCYEGKSLKWGKHRMAIFPTEEMGLAAVRSFLRKFQAERDILLMMNMFSPTSDKNDPQEYAARIATELGVPVSTLVKNMNDAQIEAFALVIKREEGWLAGETRPRGHPDLPPDIRKRT
jgi:uncharacterized protein DUF4157